MNDLLSAYLMRFEKEEIIRIMEAALRSPEVDPQSSIMVALGAELMPKDDILQWKMPTVEEAIENIANKEVDNLLQSGV